VRKNAIKPQRDGVSPAKSRLMARLIADGAVYKSKSNYTMKYECQDRGLLESFVNDFKEVYGLEPKRGWNRSGKTGRLVPYCRVRSVDAYKDLVSYSSYYSRKWRVPLEIIGSPRDVQKCFVQAFFDDEGTVLRKANLLRMYSINKRGLEDIGLILRGFGIAHKLRSGFGLRRNVYGIEIVGRGMVQKFYEVFGSMCYKKKAAMESIVTKTNKQAF